VEPAAGMSLRCARAILELVRGRLQEALAAFRNAEKLAATLAGPHTLVTSMRSHMLQALARAGQTGRAGQVMAELGPGERASAEMRTAEAELRLATGDPQGAADALAPVLDGAVCGVRRVRMVTALLLEARVRDALGDQATAGRVLEQALDSTEATGIVLPFLLDPVRALLEQRRKGGTAHHALISQILDLLSETARSTPSGSQAGWARSPSLDEPLTDSETRVLRYLPTQLTTYEIANELCVSANTVATHRRHLYAKLGAHSRHEAVDAPAPSACSPPPQEGLRVHCLRRRPRCPPVPDRERTDVAVVRPRAPQTPRRPARGRQRRRSRPRRPARHPPAQRPLPPSCPV
jgi:LuxR family maltose regulon positive regulatory protein